MIELTLNTELNVAGVVADSGNASEVAFVDAYMPDDPERLTVVDCGWIIVGREEVGRLVQLAETNGLQVLVADQLNQEA